MRKGSVSFLFVLHQVFAHFHKSCLTQKWQVERARAGPCSRRKTENGTFSSAASAEASSAAALLPSLRTQTFKEPDCNSGHQGALPSLSNTPLREAFAWFSPRCQAALPACRASPRHCSPGGSVGHKQNGRRSACQLFCG